MKKRALLVGINYVGTGKDLRGCINDVENMHSFLQGKGFNEFKIILEKEATTEGIKAGLEWLITGATPGDVLVFHYSGHGSQYPSITEVDRYEEIICPIDLNWKDKVITDDTLKQIFNRVPNGVNTTLFLDCCHSGTMLDQSETLGGSAISGSSAVKKTRKKKGSRYMKPPASIGKKLANRHLVDWQTSRDVNQGALLIAGSHASQTAADALIDGTFQGAATASMLEIVDRNPDASYRDIVLGMRVFLHQRGFSQIPQLDGSPSLYDNKFLDPFVTPQTLENETFTEKLSEDSSIIDFPDSDLFIDSLNFDELELSDDSKRGYSKTMALLLFIVVALVAVVLFVI